MSPGQKGEMKWDAREGGRIAELWGLESAPPSFGTGMGFNNQNFLDNDRNEGPHAKYNGTSFASYLLINEQHWFYHFSSDECIGMT